MSVDPIVQVRSMDGGSTCYGAAGGGHLDVLKWARAHGAPWDESTCWRASKDGHLELLQWTRAQGASG